MKKEEKNSIILFLSLKRISKTCIEKAIEIAKNENLDLLTYYVVTSEQIKYLSKTIEELGFIGFEATQKVSSLLENEESLKAKNVIEWINETALSNSVNNISSIIHGDFYKVVKEMIKKHKPDKIILTRAHWGFITKQWFGSVVDKLLKTESCPIIIVEKKKNDDIF